MPGEFEIIRRYFANASGDHPQVQLGIGDDCALTTLPPDTQLALSIDTLVEGVHFLPDIAPADLAWRLLGSAVSDLAAMGASPAWITLALTLKDSDSEWLEQFSKGLSEACHQYGVSLIGGDTTSGSINVLSAQVHGFVETGKGLKRSGAQPGDLIFVSGSLGDSRAGLATLTGELAANEYLLTRYLRPTPRVELGVALRDIASAAIDISDGLLADLGHILKQSQVAAEIECSQLPISEVLAQSVSQPCADHWALTGGEDFELCFTVPSEKSASVVELAKVLSLNLTEIGCIVAGEGIQLTDKGVVKALPETFGFDHFQKQGNP